MRGTLKPNGYPQHHIAGTTILAAGREFIVDEKQAAFLVDKPGEPLRLSPAGYEHFRTEFGKALICEPIGAPDGEAAAKKIAALEQQLAVAARELATRELRIAEHEASRVSGMQRIAELEKAVADLKSTHEADIEQIVERDRRIADLEAQLAAKPNKAPKPEKQPEKAA